MSDKINPHHVERKAILYLRQSSTYQVQNNLESQKLQYAMRDRLCSLGWRDIEVVDEDLGRTASGTVTRVEAASRPTSCSTMTTTCMPNLTGVLPRPGSSANLERADRSSPTGIRSAGRMRFVLTPAPCRCAATIPPPDDGAV